MTLDESVHGMRLRVIERAQVQGNVSAVCRELGISRTVFYRWRNRLERYGVDGVHPRRQRAQAGRPVATAPEVERLVLAIAISAATWGCRRIAAYLARTWRVRLAHSTVQRLLRRVLTEGGPEFRGAFEPACRRLGIRHTRTKPRHAWTNVFVERPQGTILQEHWRVAFSRHYFTSRVALQRALDGFMRYYNTERPHQGHRVRRRTL